MKETTDGEETELLASRRENLAALRDRGVEPYPHRFEYDLTTTQVVQKHGSASKEELEKSSARCRVPGRLVAKRGHGLAAFADITDGATALQLYIKQEDIGESEYGLFELFDIGDFVGVEGEVFRTKTDELTIRVENLVLLAKSLRPLPEKFHGLRDTELRYRKRYLDLIANPPIRRLFEQRAAIIQFTRAFLRDRGFVEVETPMLHAIPTGAAAEPFTTYHAALGQRLFLRIAPELHLKRLLVGGFDRVYEINRNFRNEGISRLHNPEFTMLELYQAYSDYRDLMDLTEELIGALVDELLETRKFQYQGNALDLSSPWERVPFLEAIEKFATDLPASDDEQALLDYAAKKEIQVDRSDREVVLGAIFEKEVEPTLPNATFVIDYPKTLSPLAKSKPDNQEIVERFELFLGGIEIANAYTELNDPEDQEGRFVEQGGEWDRDFVEALEYGMPPAAGIGIGIDRLTMVLSDAPSIREVILFPQLRPKSPSE